MNVYNLSLQTLPPLPLNRLAPRLRRSVEGLNLELEEVFVSEKPDDQQGARGVSRVNPLFTPSCEKNQNNYHLSPLPHVPVEAGRAHGVGSLVSVRRLLEDRCQWRPEAASGSTGDPTDVELFSSPPGEANPHFTL